MTDTPTKICIYGARGRMGQRLIECAGANPELSVIARYDRDLKEGDISQADAVIDFSLPQATETLLEHLSGTSAALVSGVTGRSPAQEEAIRNEAARRPVFIAANFSLGIAVLNHLVKQAVRALGPSFDSEVFEIHHRRKADAPSGTALELARSAADAAHYDWPDSRRVRDGKDALRGEKEVGTAAIRGGTVAGEHTVYLLGDSERIELTHRATNRDVFALGALRASQWVSRQEPGLYDMTSMLDF